MNTTDRKSGRSALARASLLAACCWGLGACWAAESASDAHAAEKATIEARYQEAVQACRSHFAVNACLQEARASRQRALQPLLDQELAQTLAQREQRASESRLRRQQKAQDQAQLEAQKRSAALLAPPVRPVPAEVQPSASAASRPGKVLPDLEKQRAEDEVAAAQRARDQRSRVQKAEEHRRQALQRLQERALHKPLAPPLPPASGASAPR